MKTGLKNSPSYSAGEEIFNAGTHGTGVVLSIFGLVILIIKSIHYGTAVHIVSAVIFGTSMVLLYLSSTLYHSFTRERAKHIFKILDHSSIYLLIAGSYTPFTLVTLHGSWGWSLFGIVWGLALIGITAKVVFINKFKSLSLILYLSMGWIIVIAVKPLIHALPAEGLYWLIAGGLAYTIGTVFYIMKKVKYSHGIWHLFVLTGTVCHFFAIYYYVIPNTIR
ncbi:MAG: hemolysin III family protein [Spirochaetes bacterium]|nr:hemolysin III family protein [Spirochaetota bacterium]